MWNQIKAVGSTLLGSPKQERGLKNINDFLTEYFNNILEQKNTPNLTVLEECNILMKLRNIKEILTPNTSFISKYEYKDVITWLSNNTRSIFNETLVKPNSGLAEFINVTALDFSNYPFITDDTPYIANYLRNNKTIEQVFLDNCGINDKQIKILAAVFRLNKTITKLSLVNNKAILDIKLKPYQVTDNVESNKEQKKYYKEALEWLDKLTGSQAEHIVISINEIKANAHYYLGMIYENSKSIGLEQ